jgi:TonB-dependent starch-binding outer membrane protein SusC
MPKRCKTSKMARSKTTCKSHLTKHLKIKLMKKKFTQLAISYKQLLAFQVSPLIRIAVLIGLIYSAASLSSTQFLMAHPTKSTSNILIDIKGKVTDEKGEGLPGVSISVKGSTNGTTSDANGGYSLAVADEKAVLVFSYIGYLPQEHPVGKQSTINVSLKTDAKALEEVVVVGYGTAKKRDVTGAVVRANIESFSESPNVSILQSLQGAAPGLNVGAVTTAGSDPEISVRGRTSISGSNSPLIVLDGIIYRGSLVDLNPNDIASIDILKDASAAAIYGSQASNGVILITSKTGKANQKPSIEYSTSYSLQEISNKKMLPEDGAGFIRKIGDRFLSESRSGTGLMTPNPNWDPASKFFGPEILKGYQTGVETNWWELLTNKNPLIQNHNIGVSGKNALSAYFFSLGYTDQENVVINDKFKRYNFRVNLDTDINDWMKVGIQSFLGISNYSGVSPSLGNIIQLPPQVAYRDEAGELILQPYRGTLNPFYQIDQQNLDTRKNLFGLLYADINIPFIKGLNYRLNFSQNLIDDKDYNFNAYAENFTGAGSKSNSSQYLLTLDNILSYKKDFGVHSVNSTFVYGIEKRDFESTTARSMLFTNDILGYNKLDAGQSGLQNVSSNAWKEASLYAMLRLIYSYKDNYIFTGTVRRDGFSGFGPNHKFGVFPSAAFAWWLSEEDFIKDNITAIDDLKLRVSYGINGNRTVGRYQTLAKIGSSVGNGYLYGDGAPAEIGQNMSSLANSDLKWESTRSLNLGADFSLIKNRIFGSVEYYIANTYDLLFNINIPVLNGFGSTPTNIGKLANKGQELSLTVVPVQQNDFSWNVSFNFSRNRNKVVSILGIDGNKDGKEDDLVSSKIFIAHPYGVAYDYNITGMWQMADQEAGKIPKGFTYGTYKVEDVNGDEAYTAAADRKILGYTDPSYRFSIMNAVNYKAWEFKFFINSIQGGKDYYYGQPGASLANPDNIYGSNLFKFDYWTPENPDARYRQIGYYTVALGETFSPYIQRSFVRLQDATLSYSLPKTALQKVKINRAKLFVNGKNLLTLSDWDGWDPETGSGLNAGAYPLLRSYTAGFNFEF